MSRYYLLYLFALLPWALLFLRGRNKPPRVFFAPLFLLTSKRLRKRRRFREIALAASRSIALFAFITLVAPDVPKQTQPEREPPNTLRRVLIVDGSDSGPTRFAQTIDAPSVAEYLSCAIELETETIAASELSERSLSNLLDYDAAILADVSSPTEAELDRLKGFAQDGKHFVLIWTGVRVVPERWNDALSKLGSAARIVDVNDVAARYSRFYRASALSRIFPDAKAARVDALPVERLQAVENAEALLRDSGTGAIVFAKLYPGWYWFGASPDPNAGALASAPYFATLVEKTLELASSGADNEVVATSRRSSRAWALVLAFVLAMATELALARVPQERASA